MNNWSSKSALTNKELECLSHISTLFSQHKQTKANSLANNSNPDLSENKARIPEQEAKKDPLISKKEELDYLLINA